MLKLLRVGECGRERSAAAHADGRVVDLSPLVEGIGPETLDPAAPTDLTAKMDLLGPRLPELHMSHRRIGPPPSRVGKTFSPLGPWLVTADEIGDPQALAMELTVSGEIRQSSSAGDLTFGVAHLLWYISQFMVLHLGDVINTGTPQGVGSGFTPPRFLRDDHSGQLSIAGLGSQCHAIRRTVVTA